jgi:hypothetical protein
MDSIDMRLAQTCETARIVAKEESRDAVECTILEVPRPALIKNTSFTSTAGSITPFGSIEDEDEDYQKLSGSPRTSLSVTPQHQEKLSQAQHFHKSCSTFQHYRDLTWRRFFVTYRSIFGLVFFSNLLALCLVLRYKSPNQNGDYYRTWLPVCASVNFLFGTLSRNEHFINSLFETMLLVPASWPLSIRKVFAQVHHYGGLHSGCHTAGTMWVIAITALN